MLFAVHEKLYAQNAISNTAEPVIQKADTSSKQRSVASKAALRSTILPGLGQVYNKKYWKVPIVYGIIAIPVSLYSYNRKWYNLTRNAYTIRSTKDSAKNEEILGELDDLSASDKDKDQDGDIDEILGLT
jgi:hypothetical protein